MLLSIGVPWYKRIKKKKKQQKNSTLNIGHTTVVVCTVEIPSSRLKRNWNTFDSCYIAKGKLQVPAVSNSLKTQVKCILKKKKILKNKITTTKQKINL